MKNKNSKSILFWIYSITIALTLLIIDVILTDWIIDLTLEGNAEKTLSNCAYGNCGLVVSKTVIVTVFSILLIISAIIYIKIIKKLSK